MCVRCVCVVCALYVRFVSKGRRVETNSTSEAYGGAIRFEVTEVWGRGRGGECRWLGEAVTVVRSSDVRSFVDCALIHRNS